MSLCKRTRSAGEPNIKVYKKRKKTDFYLLDDKKDKAEPYKVFEIQD